MGQSGLTFWLKKVTHTNEFGFVFELIPCTELHY